MFKARKMPNFSEVYEPRRSLGSIEPPTFNGNMNL